MTEKKVKQIATILLALLVSGCTSTSYPYGSVKLGIPVSDTVAREEAPDGDIPAWLEAGWRWELDRNISVSAGYLHRSNVDLAPPEYNMDAIIGGIEISGKK